MKTLLVILLFPLQLFARQVFVREAGNDAAAGTTDATAWKSISKVNSSATNGDTVYFNRGDSWYGTIIPTVSNITYTAYGTGANPIITGLTTLSSWSDLGANIWEAVVTDGLPTLSMVIISNRIVAMGRTPNTNAANDGYLTYQSTSGSNQITSSALSGTPNYTGAELLVRAKNYITVRTNITSQSTSTLNFPTSSTTLWNVNQGFFIQNHITCLDEQNEWLYDTTGGTKKLKMFSIGNPGTVQVATLSTLVSMVYSPGGGIRSNLRFRGLDFIGCENEIVEATWVNDLLIDSCTLKFAGENAIDTRYTPRCVISNCTISDINSIGMHDFSTNLTWNIRIINNQWNRIARNVGLLTKRAFYNVTSPGTGIQLGSRNAIVYGNIMDSIGYCAIRFGIYDSQIIRRNIVTNYCRIKNDGGAIYNSVRTNNVDPKNFGVIIDSNFVYKNENATMGTNSTTTPLFEHVRAIYLDANSANLTVKDNFVNNAQEGIYISAASGNVITGNIIFGGGKRIGYSAGMFSINSTNVGYDSVRNNTVTNNTFYAFNDNQSFFEHYDLENSLLLWGTMDNNYFFNPGASPRAATYSGLTYSALNYSGWRSLYPQFNVNSTYSIDSGTLHTNTTLLPITISFPGFANKDSRGTNYNNSYTMQPFTAVILFANGSAPLPNPTNKINTIMRFKN